MLRSLSLFIGLKNMSYGFHVSRISTRVACTYVLGISETLGVARSLEGATTLAIVSITRILYNISLLEEFYTKDFRQYDAHG